ncbi:PREDICTED: transmembrane protein 242-like [Amphimedon queenslandica]|uniref:Transmembrane protein 242 n=1 Tax=Amphimedon queenslandica TaxID=400682 RepID=A0A1X7UZ91_AMPQE|nr:PREDICTED: transmembrane protein 242-like [Amphimedon queenslandica]|eukprot:XP_003386280.1 PREDICTED: transmembrane protein 242-like [Amphimedon queenslandica]
MPSDSSTLFVVGSVAAVSFIGAFGVSVGLARRKSPEAFSRNAVQGQVNPARLAMRALGFGTVLAVVGVSGLVLSIKYALGIKNASEFGDRIHKMVPDDARISNKKKTD